MADFPYMKLWTDAYLSDTGHLSTMEHGAYLLLLMTAWRTPDCSLPDCDKLLARYARLTPAQWRRSKQTILAFWHLDEGTWKQKRLSCERNAVKRKSESGKSGSDARWLKNKQPTDANASPQQCQTDASHSHSHNHIGANAPIPLNPPKTKARFPVPDWVPEAEWAGYCEMRTRIKAPLTDRAKAGIIRELQRLAEDGQPPGKVLDQSTQNAWRGVFPLKEAHDGKRSISERGSTADRQYRYDPAWEGLKRLRAEFGDG